MTEREGRVSIYMWDFDSQGMGVRSILKYVAGAGGCIYVFVRYTVVGPWWGAAGRGTYVSPYKTLGGGGGERMGQGIEGGGEADSWFPF